MLTKQQKIDTVSGLEERFRRQKISIFTDFRGIGVSKLSAFRRELKAMGAEFKVAKKTLFGRALSALGIGIDAKSLEGEIGVIFSYEDQIAPAKAAVRFAKENETFKVLRGVLAGKVIEARDILALAKLPPRDALLGAIAGALASPIRGLAAALAGNIRNLVGVLKNISDKKI